MIRDPCSSIRPCMTCNATCTKLLFLSLCVLLLRGPSRTSGCTMSFQLRLLLRCASFSLFLGWSYPVTLAYTRLTVISTGHNNTLSNSPRLLCRLLILLLLVLLRLLGWPTRLSLDDDLSKRTNSRVRSVEQIIHIQTSTAVQPLSIERVE